jgi:hypothetical protein
MIEIIKAIGSYIGLLTGIFVFYDRFAKGRPVVSITIAQEGTRPSPRIRITNTSPYDIAIHDITTQSTAYLLAEDEGAERNLRASFGMRPYFMLKPNESKEVRMVPRFENGVPVEIMGDQRIIFWVWWRRGNATWLPQIPIPVVTSVVFIRKFGLEMPDVPI